jgi:hypothetical protein
MVGLRTEIQRAGQTALAAPAGRRPSRHRTLASRFGSRWAPHALDVAAGAESGAGAGDQQRADVGFLAAGLIMLRSAGVSVSDSALRTSGRFSVMTGDAVADHAAAVHRCRCRW